MTVIGNYGNGVGPTATRLFGNRWVLALIVGPLTPVITLDSRRRLMWMDYLLVVGQSFVPL
jgi:hypothetical protein